MDPLKHDGVVHHPLGSSSYFFKKSLIPYVASRCLHERILVHVGSQPNGMPHLGNCTTFATAFAVAAALQAHTKKQVRVIFVYVDTAPANNSLVTISGVKYQRSLADLQEVDKMSPHYSRILVGLSTVSGVEYRTETQRLWATHPRFVHVLKHIIAHRATYGPSLSPEAKKLAIRAACPIAECGLADQEGIHNDYSDDNEIKFHCAIHGAFVVRLDNEQDLLRLGFSTPLRNLIRISLCSEHNSQKTSWVMCTGAEYAGLYQEQFLWRLLKYGNTAPVIIYAPLIVDWSSAKLSKSMYVDHGSYRYLRDAGLEYAVDGAKFVEAENGVEALYEEVDSWVAEPFKLFRNYSIDYMNRQLFMRGMRKTTCRTKR